MLSIEILFFLGVVVVGLALAIGMYRSARRNPANVAISDAATRELYEDPDRYENSTRSELEGKIRPS